MLIAARGPCEGTDALVVLGGERSSQGIQKEGDHAFLEEVIETFNPRRILVLKIQIQHTK